MSDRVKESIHFFRKLVFVESMELLIEYFLEIHILVYETFKTLCEILAVHFCVSYDLYFSL